MSRLWLGQPLKFGTVISAGQHGTMLVVAGPMDREVVIPDGDYETVIGVGEHAALVLSSPLDSLVQDAPSTPGILTFLMPFGEEPFEWHIVEDPS